MERVEILYQDRNIIVISKPCGLMSVGFEGFRGRTAENLIENILRKKGEYSQKYRPFAVHRLDRDTSGVMMFATNERAQKIIMDSWHKMVKHRKYIALSETPVNFTKYGILPESGIIDDKLSYNAYNIGYVAGHDEKKNADRSQKTRTDSRNPEKKEITARTHFRVLRSSTKFTLFELELDTGRKNQIRAHLASKGYPIAGDQNYRSHANPFDRLCLHAKTLEYVDPWSDELHSFEVAEPEEWGKIVK